MFFFLFNLSLSAALTSQNSSLFFSNAEHTPYFAILVSDWCPHCLAAKDVFDSIEKTYENDTRLLVLRINCDRDPSVCRNFPETSTPGVFWIRTKPEQSEQYNGAMTFSNLKSFVEKHFGQSLIDIENKEQYEKELENHKESSIFVYQQAENDTMFSKIRYIALTMQEYPCNFFNLKFNLNASARGQSVFFNINPETGIVVPFNEQFTEKNIKDFINKYAFPPISLISVLFFNHASENNQTVLLLADDVPLFQPRFREMIYKMPPDLRTGIIYCGNSPNLCMDLVILTNKGPQLQMYNPKMKLQYYYKDGLNEKELVEWVHNVYAGKVWAAGSGAGFIGFLYNIFDNAKRLGIVPLVLTCLVFVVFILTFVFGIASSFHQYQRKKAYYSKLE